MYKGRRKFGSQTVALKFIGKVRRHATALRCRLLTAVARCSVSAPPLTVHAPLPLLLSVPIEQKGKSEKELAALRQEMHILASLTGCAYVIRMLDWFETASEICVPWMTRE